MPNVYQAARAFGLFRVMTALLDRTDLVARLATSAPFTLLLPPDDAFAAGPGGLEAWLLRAEREHLRALLARHLLPGRQSIAALCAAGRAETLHGEELWVVAGERPIIAGAIVLQADVRADNGLLHVIDRVIGAEAGA